MESIYTEIALYGSKSECARTDTVFLPISEVCDGTVSLICDRHSPESGMPVTLLLLSSQTLIKAKIKLALENPLFSSWTHIFRPICFEKP